MTRVDGHELPDGPGADGRTRVAMFVLNPCHNDARVRKEAESLGSAGYDVRIFALGNSLWPAGVVEEDGFSIQRIEVVSRYQRILLGLAGLYRGRRGREAVAPALGAPVEPPPPPRVLPRPVKAALLLLGLPLLVLAALRRLDIAAWRALVLASRRAAAALRGFGARAAAPLHEWAARRPADADPSLMGRMHWTLLRAQRRAGRLLRRVARSLARRLGGRARRRPLWRLRRLLRRAGTALRQLRRRVARGLYLRANRFLRKRLRVLHRPSVFLQFWKAAGQQAAAWRPDVVHAHDLNALPAAFEVIEVLGRRLPVVYDSHELWRHRNRVTRFHPVGKAFDALQERRLIRRCDLVITVSPSIETWLARRYRLPAERGLVVRNVPWRSEPVSGGTVRELAGLTRERILLYTGRVTSGRGLEEAVDALDRLPGDLALVMLGYGDLLYLEELWERAEARGVRSRVHLVPPVPSDQVAAVAASADLALVAIQPLCLSYEYALPNKLFEAIQAQVPVVATGLPEIAAVVRRYGLGELFSPGDPAAFRDAVGAMLADLDRYRAGVRTAAQELVWENEAGVLVRAYSTLLGRPSAGVADVAEARRAVAG